MSEIEKINAEALGHTFNIMPGVGYSLGKDDFTFAIQWQDKSVYTYRIVEANDDMTYTVTLISEQDCTADLTNFTPFFAPHHDPENDEEPNIYDDYEDPNFDDDYEPDFEPEPFEEDWATDFDMEPMDYGMFEDF